MVGIIIGIKNLYMFNKISDDNLGVFQSFLSTVFEKPGQENYPIIFETCSSTL